MKKIGKSFQLFLEDIYHFLNNRGVLNAYIPRWIVLFLDMFCITAAYAFMIILFKTLISNHINSGILNRYAVIMIVFFAMEFCFKIYRGTIRYSGLSEITRLFLYIMTSTALTALTLHYLSTSSSLYYISNIWLIIHAAGAFFLMFLTRIFIRYGHYFFKTLSRRRQRAFIFGSDPNTINLAQMMAADISSKYKPVAILDSNISFKGMRCGTIPIKRLNGDIDSLKDLIEIFQVQKIIFTEKQLKEIKGDLLDLFLSTHLGLMVVRDSSFIEDNDPGQNKQLSVDSIKIEDLLNREVITTDNDDISSNHKDKCVLITGASGSIGSEIVMQVAQFAPSTIILLDQAESPLYEIELKIKNLFPQLNSVIFIGDIRNKTRMTEVFETFRPDIVYHCAAYKHVPMMERYPAEAIKANVMGTKIISDLAVKYNASKFIMVSTDKAVNPTNVMGASKRIAELYVQSLNNHQGTNGTNFITTRFGNVLGSNGSVVPLFKDQIRKGGPVTITHKDIIRYFMTIPEACRLVLEAGCMGKGGEIFVFDMGEPVKIYDLARRMIRLSGLTPDVDIKIIETGLRPGEKLYEELLNDTEKTLPTHHEKIKIAKVYEADYNEVNQSVKSLIETALCSESFEIVKKMKCIVPEFKSNNSVFEKLDKVKPQ